MKKSKLWLILVLGVFGVFSTIKSLETEAASLYTISGTTFQDVNQNGKMDLLRFEVGVKNQQVTLYGSAEDAQSNQNPLKTDKSNVLGNFTFRGLKKGTYYLKYNEDDSKYSTHATTESFIDHEGEAVPNVYPVTLKSGVFIKEQDLPLIKKVSLSVTPFNDINFNGVKDSDEEILNDKTMLVLNVELFAQAIKDGTLGDVDIANIIQGALKDGNIDLVDGVHLRTVKNNEAINMDNLETGAYAIIRSPFDLTVGEILNNRKRLEAIIEILVNGDIQGILNNPTLIGTGDIDTNRDNKGIYFLANTLEKMARISNKVNYGEVLEEDQAKSVSKTSQQLQGIADLLNTLPAYKLGVVNYYGNVFDITGFKVKRTDEFYFGIKDYASLTGVAFSDSNNDGHLGKLELSGFASTISAYDEFGNLLGQSKTSSSSRGYKFERLPFDTDIYLVVDTDRAVYPLVDQSEVPEALQGQKVVSKTTISKFEKNPIITQNIGGVGNTSQPITVELDSVDQELETAILSFNSSDKSNARTVFYTLNDDDEENIVLKKAPSFGSSKAVKQEINNVLVDQENAVKMYTTLGVYKIELPDLAF